MTLAARVFHASWITRRRSYRIRIRRSPFNQLIVRSTTQRTFPKPLPWALFRRLIFGSIPNQDRIQRVTAEDIRKANLNWRASLLETWGLTEDKIILAQLLANESLSPEARVQALKDQTKKSRATFFRLAKELRWAG